jgi:four helix bundle protein
MRNFRELKIWQRAMDFVVNIYKITKEFSAEEKYGLG